MVTFLVRTQNYQRCFQSHAWLSADQAQPSDFDNDGNIWISYNALHYCIYILLYVDAIVYRYYCIQILLFITFISVTISKEALKD